MNLKTISFLLPLVLLLALSAFAKDGEKDDESGDDAAKITNKTCPVMEGEPVLPDLFVEYEGKRVYFCCESCVDDFKADPEAYIGNLPQFQGAPMTSEEGESEDGEAEEEDDRGGGAMSDPETEHPLGVLHPIVIHFPIAFSAGAVLAVLLALLTRRPTLTGTATFCVVLAALSGIPANLLGGEAEEAIGRMGEAQHERIETHELWGNIAMYVLIAVAVLWLVHRAKPQVAPLRWTAVLAVLAAAAVVTITGYYGGEVTHPGHLSHLLPF
jgi:uncharacterized membrane protein